MATSGLYSFTVTRDDIINAALRSLSVLDQASTANATDLTNCGQALNILMKEWADDGAPLWAIQWIQVPLTTGTASYTIGPSGTISLSYRPTRVISAFLRNNLTNLDNTVELVSRSAYEMLGDKSSPGIVNQVYYDGQLANGVLYCYNVPVDSDYTLWLSVQRPMQDITAGSQNFEVPQEWFLSLKWSLAEEVALEYGVDQQTLQYVTQKAAHFKQKAFDWQQEETSVYFSVDPQSMYLGRR